MRSSSVNVPALGRRLGRRGGRAEASLRAGVQRLLLYGGFNAEALVRRAVEAVESLDAEGLEATQRRFD